MLFVLRFLLAESYFFSNYIDIITKFYFEEHDIKLYFCNSSLKLYHFENVKVLIFLLGIINVGSER